MAQKINYFRLFMEYMGYNQKQVAQAGSDIGLGNRVSASKRKSGELETTMTDRLAMSAVAAGLKPWSPRYHHQLVLMKSISELIDDRVADQLARDQRRSNSSTDSSPTSKETQSNP